MEGIRVFPSDKGIMSRREIYIAGAYGQHTDPNLDDETKWWIVTTPTNYTLKLDPAIYTVVEHEDKSISVTPDIVVEGNYSGSLTRGVWS